MTVVVFVAGLLVGVTPASASLTHFLEPRASYPFAASGLEAWFSGIAVEQENHFVYATNQAHSLLKYDSSGNAVDFSALASHRISLGEGTLLHDAVDSEGNIYVVDNAQAVVRKFLPSGEPGVPAEVGSSVLFGPVATAVSEGGDIYVLETSKEGAKYVNVIDEFEPDGTLLRSFGKGVLGEAAGRDDLALDSEGHLYVAVGRAGVYGFAADGSCLDSCQRLDTGIAAAVAVEPGTDHLFVAHVDNAGRSGQVTEYGSFAQGIEPIDSFGRAALTDYTDSIAVDGATGNVYVSDLDSHSGEPRVDVFGPAVLVPTVQVSGASAVLQTSATLEGMIDSAGTEPADAITECRFEYVTQEAFEATGFGDLSSGGEGTCEPPPASIPVDGAPHQVSLPVSGLEPKTAYRVRLLAANENNQGRGEPDEAQGSFSTAGPPAIDAQYVSNFEPTSVTLNAKVNPFELDTKAHFEYIDEEAFQANIESGHEGFAGAAVTPEADLGSGLGDQTVSEPLTGLSPGTTYHYRLVAENSAATVAGPDQKFTALAAALFAVQGPTALTTSSAQVHVYIDPLALPTSYRFEYVTDQHFQAEGFANPSSTPETGAGEGEAFSLQSAPLSGLEPGTEYHLRVVATNATGTSTSPDFPFETLPASCPNEIRREEDGSTALPDCRAYEMVSPPNKAGGQARLEDAAPGGTRAFYTSLGSFAGDQSGVYPAPYVARRGPEGWSTESALPEASLGRPAGSAPTGWNSEMTEILSPPMVAGAANEGEALRATSGVFYLRRPDGTWTPASPLITGTEGLSPMTLERQVSPDLSKAVIGVGAESHPALLPSEISAKEHLYELSGIGGLSPQLNVVNRDNTGAEIPVCNESGHLLATAGSAYGQQLERPDANPISVDGSRIFFSEASPSLPGGCPIAHLLVRIDGSETLDLSDPADPLLGPRLNEACQTPACQNSPVSTAQFVGASTDGSKAFFLSSQRLTDTATQGSVNLYEYDFSRPEGRRLVDLSAGELGSRPELHEALASAGDGSRIYFTAAAVLTRQPNSLGGIARDGAENLYSVDAETGAVAFIALRCSGTELSGGVHGVGACPGAGDDSNIGDGDQERLFASTQNGRFLVFSTFGQLVPDDTNAAADVYRYDALTGAILRVSVGHDGEDENGNGGGQNATAVEASNFNLRQPFMSADGSVVAFSTARPLEAQAQAGITSAYEWRDGTVNLISSGAVNVERVTSDVSGQDLFFTTQQGLLPQDTDGLADIYDVRSGGGFAAAGEPPAECESGESCHGEPTRPGQQPALGSESFVGPPNPKYCPKGRVLRRGRCVKVHKRHHRRHRLHKKKGSK